MSFDTVTLISLGGAIAMASLGWWLAWLFAELTDEFVQIDAHHAGIFYLMLPLARKLAPVTEAMHILPVQKYTKWAEKQLSLSGMDSIFTAREYVGSHIVLLIIGIVLPTSLLLLDPAMDPRMPLMLGLMLGGIFFFLPFYYLNTVITSRKWAIFISLPYFLDLLTLLVESGLEFTIAIERAVGMLKKGALLLEITRFSKQLALGRSRKKALVELGERCDLPEVRSFVTAMIQQEELGTPLADVLRNQADMMRFRRVQVAEEKANKAPVKILFPMVLFIFPSIFLILIGPMVIRAASQVHGGP